MEIEYAGSPGQAQPIGELALHAGKVIEIRGHIQTMRMLGQIAFILLRDQTGMVQVIVEKPELLVTAKTLSNETTVRVKGLVVSQPGKYGKAAASSDEIFEIQAAEITPLSETAEPLPVEISKPEKMKALSLSTMLDYRPITLRSQHSKAIFKIEAAFCSAFREYLNAQRFTEIHSPKIVSTGTEGGAHLFQLDYFGTSAYLAQSPQFYKQIMVGVFERVFEIGPVYRAEEHDTTRHLNEYISMDFEMGFIESEQDLIEMQTGLLKHMFASVKETCAPELALFEATIPEIKTIPQLSLEEACRLLRAECGWQPATTTTTTTTETETETEAEAEAGAGAAAAATTGASSSSEEESTILDLDPEGERLLTIYFLEKEGSELVYVTGYPHSVRPFYAMPLEKKTETGMSMKLSRSFDLLYRGLEITTGGQRIHNASALKESMSARGLDPAQFADYLQAFRYGMPPHGGLAIGLERLTKQLLQLPTVKLAALFPRDRNRLRP
jgi:nondiscriminating aspartyl-tRNA synthetase